MQKSKPAVPLYGLETPSGITVPVGRKKPKLTAADKRDHWKVVRLKNKPRKGV